LHYFDLYGRAEPAVAMLSVSGTPFDKVALNFAEWPTKFKFNSPYDGGSLPITINTEGIKLTQSKA
jgi:hypothetical protein